MQLKVGFDLSPFLTRLILSSPVLISLIRGLNILSGLENIVKIDMDEIDYMM
jgi:hypothetical protein